MNFVYNEFKFLLSNGQINLLTDTLKILLVNSYSVDIDNHNFVSDISAYEIIGGGYTSGGQVLLNQAVIRNDVNNRTQLTASNLQWPTSYINANGGIIYKDTGDKTTSPLICFIDFGGQKSTNNTPFIIEWSVQEGILYIT